MAVSQERPRCQLAPPTYNSTMQQALDFIISRTLHIMEFLMIIRKYSLKYMSPTWSFTEGEDCLISNYSLETDFVVQI